MLEKDKLMCLKKCHRENLYHFKMHLTPSKLSVSFSDLRNGGFKYCNSALLSLSGNSNYIDISEFGNWLIWFTVGLKEMIYLLIVGLFNNANIFAIISPK